MANVIDNACKALANRNRRRVLLSLFHHNPQAEGSFDVPDDVSGVDQTDRERLRIEMWHIHLPMLEQAGFIEWDREQWEIGEGPSFEEIKPLLHFLEERSDWVGERSAR